MQKTEYELEKVRGGYLIRGQYVEDAAPYVRDAQRARHRQEVARTRKDAQYHRVASIPLTLALKIKAEDGVDPLNIRTPAETQQYMRVLQTKYPAFLTTNKTVYRRKQKIRIDPACLRPDL